MRCRMEQRPNTNYFDKDIRLHFTTAVLSLIIIVARLACVWSVLALHALPDPFLLLLRRMTFSFAELALTLNDLFHYA